MFTDFILSTFTISIIVGWPAGKLTWCLMLQELLQNLQIFAMLPAYASAVNCMQYFYVHQVVLIISCTVFYVFKIFFLVLHYHNTLDNIAWNFDREIFNELNIWHVKLWQIVISSHANSCWRKFRKAKFWQCLYFIK